MINKFLFFSLFVLSISIHGMAQNDSNHVKNKVFYGRLIDGSTNKPLAYANIAVVGNSIGTVTNEDGIFSLDMSELSPTDTIAFLYIGYETKKLTVEQADTIQIVRMYEDIKGLAEFFVFGNELNPKDIVRKVIENKEKNYRKAYWKNEAFIRQRYIMDMPKFVMNYKKSNISGWDEEMIQSLEKKIPRHSTSYTDMLCHIHLSNGEESPRFKLEPQKVVSLEEEDFQDLDRFQKLAVEAIKDTNENEYWQLKSGIISSKLEFNDSSKDTNRTENSDYVKDYRYMIRDYIKYISLADEDDWDFLYNIGKYRFTLVGGTNVDGEQVYIIDFIPKGGGLYEGRLYISTATYALIRADYKYAPDKEGRDIHLLGFGYTELNFEGSVYFQKKDGYYEAKYCSKRKVYSYSVERNFALEKNKERFLWDKTVKQIKIKMDMLVKTEESFEVLIMDQQKTNNSIYTNYKEPKYVDVQRVEQFDPSLWAGYNIIAPTEQMRAYKKQESLVP